MLPHGTAAVCTPATTNAGDFRMNKAIFAYLACGAAAMLLAGRVSADDTGAALGAWGVDLDNMDPSATAGDDFFRHVNGRWLDTFEIPPDFTNYGSFTELFELSERRVADIVRDAAAVPDADGLQRKIADYYSAFLDVGGIEAHGLAAARDDFAYYDGLATHDDVARALIRPDIASTSPIAPYVYVDQKHPDRYVVYFTQSGLGMPSREYYLDDKFAEQKARYPQVIDQLLTLAGAKRLPDAGERIAALEERIAEIHWPPAKQRNRDLTYNPVDGNALARRFPGFPWQAFLESGGVAGQGEYIVNELDAVEKLAALFADTPVELWREYLKFHYINSFAPVLSKDIDEANFDFFSRALHGQEQQRERRKRAIEAVNGALGEAVGRIYVQRYFPPESKLKMSGLIANVIATYRDRIEHLAWMSPATREQALAKLAKFKPFIGGPERWRDYGDVEVAADDALGNMKSANAAAWRYFVARLGKPVDPANEWGMTPQTVNAYYSPPRNAIYFPAAILQPPFFDPQADAAVNYGGIAAVIGHEIGHGFDDQGSKSDGDGVLRNWWTADDQQRFEQRTAALGAQYAGYAPVEGMFIDPALTMGENVGDLGGVAVAFAAYQLSLGGKPAPLLDGYTGAQRFFLSYGQIWKRKHRLEDLKWRLVADPHSPAEYRVNGIVRNMDAWYEAFGVGPDDALYLPPDERVQIW